MALHWAFNPLGIGGLAPYSGTRGVFLNSGAITLSSAMTMTGVTVGKHFPGNSMIVYDRGHANNIVVSGEGHLYISSGGIASSPNIRLREGDLASNGSMFVSSGGLVYDLFNVGLATVYSGGVISGGDNRNGLVVSGGTIYDFIQPYNSIILKSGGQAHRLTLSGGNLTVSDTSLVTSITLVKSATLIQSSGLVSSATVLSGGTVTMSGGTLTSAVAVSGGTVYISGASATNADFAGGSGRVYAGGTLTNVTASSGAMIAVTGEGANLSGGTAYGRLDSTADAVTVSTRIYVQSGGLIEDLVLDGTTAANTGWAKAVLYVLNGGIASNIHAKGSSYYGGSISVSRGGSAIDCEMNRYGFYIYTGGTAIRPVVSQTTGLAQLYAYGGATVYDLRNLRGTTSAHSGSYISGGVVSGGTLMEWGSATGITISAYKNGTANVRGTLQVNHGTTASASSAHVGIATDTINKGGIVTIQGGTMHTLMMQPDLEATNLGATATVRNHANNAVVAENRVGYLTDVTVSGATTAGGARSWLYISSGGVVSGATMHASGCIVVYSGGLIEDLHISNNYSGYAFSMYSGASAHNVYRVGSHGSNGVGWAVALIDSGAEVTNLYNSGGGAPYTILNRGHISGYYAYTVLNGGTVERTYLYNQHLSGGYLEDVHLYGLGSGGAAENLIYIASSSYAQNIYAESGCNTVWVTHSAFAQNLYASGGVLVVNTSRGGLAAHVSGAIAGLMYGVGSDIVIDQPFPPGAPSRTFYVYPTGSADGITRYTPNDVASTWSLVYILGGTATNVATYGGNGANINLMIYGSGHVSGLTMANYNGGSPYSEVRGGFVYNFTQSGGWFYVMASGTASTALIQNGYVTGMSEGLQKNGVIRVYSGAVASNVSALALANTDYYGVVYVSSAGITKDTYQIGGYWDVSSGGAASNHVLSGGGRLSATGINARPAYFRVSSGGVAYNVSALGSGRDSDNQVNRSWIQVYAGGYLSGAYISGYGSALTNKGGTITELIDRSQADIYGSLGIASNYAYINLGATGITGAHADYIIQYAGRTRIYAGTGDATLDDIYLSGGTVWVWQHGTLSSGIIDRGTSATAVMMVSGGGVAYNITVRGGELQLQNPSIVSNIIAINSGIVHISSAGVASTATVSSGGIMHISSAGIASAVTVLSGGTLYVSAGGEVDGGTFYSGGGALTVNSGTLRNYVASGWINVWGSSYVISCTTTPSGTIAVNNATQVQNCVLSGGAIWLQTGATGSNTTVSSGRFMISSGSIASDTVVLNGGSIYVSDGASATGITNSAGGQMHVLSGGTVTDALTYGMNFYISAGGVGSNLVGSGTSGYYQIYGSAYNVTIVDGRMSTFAGSYVSSASITGGATVYGSADDIIMSRGALHMRPPGIAVSTVVLTGASAIMSSGSVMRDTIINSGILLAYTGAVTSGAVCNYGGSAVVSSGGAAYDTTINSGGTLIVNVNGYASGGVASNASAIAWATPPDATAQVYGTLEGLTLTGPGTRVNIRAATGLVSACTATSGSYILADKGGIASNCTFNNANLVLTSNAVGRGCSASNGGSLDARTSTHLESCTVMSNAFILVRDHSVASSNTIGQGGSAIISSGGVASATTVGGTLYVSSGGSATGTVVSAGGGVRVYSTAILTNTEIMYNDGAIYRGSVKVYVGGYASGVNVHGELFAYSNGIMEDIYNTASNHIGICATFVQGGTCTNYHAEYAGNLRVGYLGSGGICSSASLLGAPTIKQYIYVSNGASIYDVNIASAAPLSKGIIIESAGAAYNISVSSGAYCYVSAGGTAEQVTATGGTVTVFSEGILSDITIVSNGLLTANDGAEVYDIVASGAVDLTKTSIQLSPFAMAYGTITVNHARAHLAGTIETMSALDSAIVVASSGCNMLSAYLEGYGTELHVQGGAVVDTIGMEQGSAYISSGGIISATDANNVYGTATISSGGLLHIGANAYFEYFVVLSGGTVYVNDTAEIDDYESEPGAVIIWGD